MNSKDDFEAATPALAWSRDVIKLMLGRRIEEYWLRSRICTFLLTTTRVHFMHLGPKIFGVYLTFCRRSGVISSIKSVLGMTAFEN